MRHEKKFCFDNSGSVSFLACSVFFVVVWGEGEAGDLSPVFKLHCQLSCADENQQGRYR